GPGLPGPARGLTPGTYWFERHLSSPQSMMIHAVDVTLEADGAARATRIDDFMFEPLHDGELARDDHESDDLAGTWTQVGADLEVTLDPVRSCARAADDVDDCARASPFPAEAWRLRCRAVDLGGSALVCARIDGELPPKYVTR